jgi:hypothetical protein
METACPRCGTLKTESVRHGFAYKLMWGLGYHLRRCSFCNRWRLNPRGDRNRPHPNDLSAEELTEHFNRRIAASLRRDGAVPSAALASSMASSGGVGSVTLERPPVAEKKISTVPPKPVPVETRRETSDDEEDADPAEIYGACPECGKTKYRRSRRRWYERWLNRPKMARCLNCDCRYPYPD